MNIRSAELLENSLQNAADNLYRNRALAASMQEETQRNAVEQSFRNAMMQHYADIEQKQADATDRQAGTLQQQQQQAGAVQKQDLLRTVMGLNSTGQLSAEGLTKVNQWLATDPDLGKTGIQLAAPANPSTDADHKQSALVQAVTMIQQLRAQAGNASDPRQADEFNRAADDLEDNLPAAVKAIPGSRKMPAEPRTPASNPQTALPSSSPVPAPAANPPSLWDKLTGQFGAAKSPPQGLSGPGNPQAAGAATVPGLDPQSSVLVPPSQPAQPTGIVRVRRPDGSTTTIPAVHLQNALQYGYKPITQ